MRYLARTIAEPGFGGDDATLRYAALWFLRDVAGAALAGVDRAMASRRDDPDVRRWLAAYLRESRSVLEWTDADAPGEVLLAAARTDCFDLLPDVFAAVEPLLADPAAQVRIGTAAATSMLSRHPDLVAHRPQLLAYHLAQCSSDDPYHRASMLLGVGELDGTPRQWLRDPHPGVRICAALAPALADDPEAIEILLTQATTNPGVMEKCALQGMMSLTALPHPAAAIAERLCRHVNDIDRLLPAAIASVPHGITYLDTGENDPTIAALCEPYLRVIFPDGLPAHSAATPTQRLLAAVVADHDPAWNRDTQGLPPQDRYLATPHAQAWDATFTRLHLPTDRSAWRTTANHA
ncbi:hypothetical protein [Luedemannella helvata]|uniref:hypothetical protein n=1 Tax=Luedemannella helvata TaxID=349315 RepID=UPI0031D17C06